MSMGSEWKQTAEERSLAEGAARVQFQCRWTGKVSSLYCKHEGLEDVVKTLQNDLSDALWELEQIGAAPILPDGKVGGNAAVKFTAGDEHYFLVSKSGKKAGNKMADGDFCVVTDFNFEHWSCEYLASSSSILPTSDTPMHICALTTNKEFNWSEQPMATLHGHALATEVEANNCGLPISVEETRCSTPEDSAALLALMKKYPYPEHKIFIRKNHGFIILGASTADVSTTLKHKLKPLIIK